MANDFPEQDWKVFREIRSSALERFCKRILDEITRIAKDTSTGSHERYLLIFQLIQDRDADIAAGFNDFRRSTALRQLAIMDGLGVLSDEELARLSSETQASVKGLSEIFRPKKGSGRRRPSKGGHNVNL
jgi:hypothetical protein